MNNKFKLFTLSAIATMSLGLVACDVTSKDGVVIDFKNDGTSSEITADELYEQYKLTSTGAKAYYDAIYNVVIRHEMGLSKNAAKKKELVTKAESQVQGIKDTATDNAKTNKTNYDDELKKLLDSNGVDTLTQLQTKFEDSLFKTYLTDNFYDWSMEYLKDGTITKTMQTEDADGSTALSKISFDSYLNDLLPYHVKHILVNVSAASGEYALGKISESEATKISYVIKRLSEISSSNTFGRIAKSSSDDSTSAKNEGDLGIMSRNTSFVNEFKLGVYTYDSLFNNQFATNTAETNKIGLKNSTDAAMVTRKEQLAALGLGEIPYGAAVKLNEYANVTTDNDGHVVNLGAEVSYPRNIYFNKFFNMHNISVITSDSVDNNGNVVNDKAYAGNSGFKDVQILNGAGVVQTKNILCDENGQPILVCRAGTGDSTSTNGSTGYQGIHFIVVQRSALTATDANGVSLSDYYTTYLPGSTNFPKKNDKEEVCYVNYFQSDNSTYLSRSNTLKDDIKKTDPSIDLKMYQYFFNKSGATIKNTTITAQIDKYIYSTEIRNGYDAEKKYADAWKDYCNMLGVQSNKQSRKFPSTCALKFKEANTTYAADFSYGGECYYEKEA
jgi:hypothetical protein